jgi:DNA-binding MarR family transcriptional regulator
VNPQAPPDLAILLAASYRALNERLLTAMADAGLDDMRPAYGFVIRAVAAERPTVNRLAELLAVTKQSASKLVDDMVRAGFLERDPDPDDRRRVRIVLSERGREVRATARRTSRTLERELARDVGDEGVAALRAGLLAFVGRHGGLEEVRAQRSRIAW